MNEYLRPTWFLDSDSPVVQQFAADAIGDAEGSRERASRLFDAVRDDIRYDPYAVSADPRLYRASTTAQARSEFCIPKAVLLAAACRAVGIPATEELARAIYARAVQLGDVSADFMLGFCLLWRGRLEEAEECFVRGREAARSRGVAVIDTLCLVYGSVVRRRRDDVEGTRAWVGELEAQDELHGYRGLTAANRAWLAFRDGDLELASGCGSDALADWQSEGRRGSRVFEWTARFPMLGVELERGRTDVALEHARAMLVQSQQPRPDSQLVISGSETISIRGTPARLKSNPL